MKIGYVMVVCGIAILSGSFKINQIMKENTGTGAVQYRIARPTDKLEKVVDFYKTVLGLEEIGVFKQHEGYDGVMLGLPGVDYHLEFTQHADGSPCPAPTKDNLLVLYFDTPLKYNRAVERALQLGNQPVEPENSYWKGKSETFEDPDGWRIVFFNGVYKP